MTASVRARGCNSFEYIKVIRRNKINGYASERNCINLTALLNHRNLKRKRTERQ